MALNPSWCSGCPTPLNQSVVRLTHTPEPQSVVWLSHASEPQSSAVPTYALGPPPEQLCPSSWPLRYLYFST
ncbi:hypothetical protein F2P81_009481 [Scophthalmus maximus]|uniref:Uncharacterized protein n=1 Tax=Scophthalmus maximus TaxID=52904 RepID=A0A6A4SZ79_SCOMX|nr:hypothetical protein F2P81_009481 [Scophthalmus maximus]